MAADRRSRRGCSGRADRMPGGWRLTPHREEPSSGSFHDLDQILNAVIGTAQVAVKTLKLVVGLVVAGKSQTCDGVLNTVVANDAIAEMRSSQERRPGRWGV